MVINLYRIGDDLVHLHVKNKFPSEKTEKKLYLMKAAYIGQAKGWNIQTKDLGTKTFTEIWREYK